MCSAKQSLTTEQKQRAWIQVLHVSPVVTIYKLIHVFKNHKKVWTETGARETHSELHQIKDLDSHNLWQNSWSAKKKEHSQSKHSWQHEDQRGLR